MRKWFTIIVYNGGGFEIDKMTLLATSETDALKRYIDEAKPLFEKGDKIEIR